MAQRTFARRVAPLFEFSGVAPQSQIATDMLLRRAWENSKIDCNAAWLGISTDS
jgi:hypothetical protein